MCVCECACEGQLLSVVTAAIACSAKATELKIVVPKIIVHFESKRFIVKYYPLQAHTTQLVSFSFTNVPSENSYIVCKRSSIALIL